MPILRESYPFIDPELGILIQNNLTLEAYVPNLSKKNITDA
tara:strand:- start:1616 stop:1738 length:123 start_codon:yes stop_codon:yes gene_type:complete